ncbi:MAG: PEP-CTERM sorting domain-containing protein [Opitutaceae bacterium]|nr:PEP-CTERM sorting domain-containing protein [Opitutaceae bacterium]
MNTIPLKTGAGLCLALCMTVPASAALVIDAGSIAGNTYTYSLTHAKVAAGDFTSDVLSSSNVHTSLFWTSNSRSAISLDTGATGGEFVYKFDFTDLDYTISQFTIDEAYRREQDGASYAARNATGFTSYYSLDGENWIQLNEVSQNVGYAVAALPAQTIELSAVTSVIYYKAVITSSGSLVGSYPDEYNNGHTGINWNYSTVGTFNVSFELASIPEPSAWAALFGVTGLLAAIILRHRRR